MPKYPVVSVNFNSKLYRAETLTMEAVVKLFSLGKKGGTKTHAMVVSRVPVQICPLQKVNFLGSNYTFLLLSSIFIVYEDMML